MQTLSDLKKNCANYEWALIENSWSKCVPDFQKCFRKVGRVQSQKFTLLTIKNGVESESWVDFPKASELTIQRNIHNLSDSYTIFFTRKCGENQPDHVMCYLIKPIN